jgi:hypothetical protein
VDRYFLSQTVAMGAHGEVYSIQHYVIQFVSDLRRVGDFLRVLQFPTPIKTDRRDITEILLKVVLRLVVIVFT